MKLILARLKRLERAIAAPRRPAVGGIVWSSREEVAEARQLEEGEHLATDCYVTQWDPLMWRTCERITCGPADLGLVYEPGGTVCGVVTYRRDQLLKVEWERGYPRSAGAAVKSN